MFPGHIETVTVAVNILRGRGPSARNAAKATCDLGHPFDRVTSNGSRLCRRCATERERRRIWRKRGCALVICHETPNVEISDSAVLSMLDAAVAHHDPKVVAA